MFDNNDLERSDYYFLLLQLLNVFLKWIQKSADDVDAMIEQCGITIEQSIRSSSSPAEVEQKTLASRIIKSDWQVNQRYQKSCVKQLLDRIASQSEDAVRLRDGVCYSALYTC